MTSWLEILVTSTRSLLNTFVHDLTTNPAVKTFHWEPEILMHQRSDTQPATQVHGEVWTSRRFRRMHKEVQRLRKPGDDLPHCVLALMPGSDGTHLAQFGTASAWPGYFDYGNRSKYVRAKRDAKTMQHCVSFPKLPDDINDTLQRLGVTQPSVKREILTHLRRELNHAAWTRLLDNDFCHAYRHGVVINCADGVTRRIFPRFFCYIADYPEKYVVLVTRMVSGKRGLIEVNLVRFGRLAPHSPSLV
ncbi:hypothetical protein EXIGLDRAFT_733851 [Exidia glandulosa HHB12029]|uniref:Uncharacterized protein n=1 Tax=Exidia glandulosa HHB12029 TaxID=1314781 RepID=A0A165B6X1_EXIGL|nr:hypothetical protein EXIGLDRAFT_733851 [Exidia glandulosa HHB12029]